MRNWMEPAALSMLLTVYLYVLAVGLLAVERAACSFAQSRKWPRWPGLRALATAWAYELRNCCVAMPPIRDSRNFRHWLGGVICLTATVLAFAVIPFGPLLNLSDESGIVGIMIAPGVEVALLFVPAMLLLGEAVAAFEVSTTRSTINRLAVWTGLILSTLGIARLSETLRIDEIVLLQAGGGIWWLARQPLGFAAMLLCLVWLTLDTRLPTHSADSRGDLQGEGRQQSKSGLFVLAARLQIIAVAYLLVILFLGGWHLWGLAPAQGDSGLTLTGWIVRLLILHLKVGAVLIWQIRFRYAQRSQYDSTSTNDASRWVAGVGAESSERSPQNRTVWGLPAVDPSHPQEVFWRADNFGDWQTRIAMAAVSVAILNIAVTESGEQFLDADSLMWKASIGWAMLVAGLSAGAVLSKKLMPE